MDSWIRLCKCGKVLRTKNWKENGGLDLCDDCLEKKHKEFWDKKGEVEDERKD